jgi:prepilin-type N-terminal cleavage/methylation domain-containing protein
MPTKHSKFVSTQQLGFTLLEMLIVLALMGLLGALALPALGRLVDSLRFQNERSGLLAQINTLSYRHYLLAQNSTLTNDNLIRPLKDGQAAVDLPEGWRANIPVPLTYQFNGYCSGGVIILLPPDHPAETLRLIAPACGVRDAK